MPDRIIQAAIVNHERTHVILDSDGNLPEKQFTAEHVTTEGTLLAIGHEALENVGYVSVDYGYGLNGKLIYQSKPVPANAEPATDYQWGIPPILLK